MIPFASGRAASRFRAAVSSSTLILTLAASGGGCTLLVGGQLSDKPSEGAGGEGGSTAAVSQSSSAAQSSGTGELMCAPGTANCDGSSVNGCEANLKNDPKTCGSCKNVCDQGEHCKEGKCN